MAAARGLFCTEDSFSPAPGGMSAPSIYEGKGIESHTGCKPTLIDFIQG